MTYERDGFLCTYRDLKDQLLAVVVGCEGVENGRELVRVEFHCIARQIRSHYEPLSSFGGVVGTVLWSEKDFPVTVSKVGGWHIPSTTAPMTW